MNREEVFECWAPAGGEWSLWARPILFAQMPEGPAVLPGEAAWLGIDVSWAPADRTALVLDLPGGEAALTGLGLAGRGCRPVPLFNACTGEHEVIDQGPILAVLRAGAPYLAGLASALAGAPPAFLLDSRRGGHLPPRAGAFDNRWKVFPQDFPSAAHLTARGVRRALLVQRGSMTPAEDLAHVLRRWQEGGLAIEALDLENPGPPAPISVAEPAWYRWAWHRALTLLGMRRGGHGGFGGVVPSPSHG